MPRIVQTPQSSGPTTRMSSLVGSAVVQGGYEDMTKDELQAELEARGLPKSGNKDELIERLLQDD